MNQIKAGKKCIGTTRLGNISAESISNGKVAEKAPKILAKENKVNTKLKMIRPVFESTLSANQKPIDARTQAKIQAPNNIEVLTKDEKSTIYALAQ